MYDSGNSDDLRYCKLYHYWIDESPAYRDPLLWHLFTWLLRRSRQKAGSIKLKKGPVVFLDVGECIVGRMAASEDLGISPSTFRDRLKKLQDLGVLTLRAKDRSFTIVSITNPLEAKNKADRSKTRRRPVKNELSSNVFIEKQEGDKPESAQTQTSPRLESAKSQTRPRSNGATKEMDKKNEMNEMNQMNEGGRGGVAASPPSLEKISSLIDEYIKTSSADERTCELSQEIQTLKDKAREIKELHEGLLAAGRISEESKEWRDAVDQHYGLARDVKAKQLYLDFLMRTNELDDVRKKDLAREFFNYWDSLDWRNKNGRPINLGAEVRKWTQREISKKHQGSIPRSKR